MRLLPIIASFLATPVIACPSVNPISTQIQFLGDIEAASRDYSRFGVVGEKKPLETRFVRDLDLEGRERLRDILIAARLGYADQSELMRAGALDEKGRVVDLDLFFERARRQINFPTMGENWSASEEEWARARFDIIRVREEGRADFQVNMSVLRLKNTDEYFISIGGTDTLEDVVSDANLVFGEDSGQGVLAALGLVNEFFARDIPKGAKVNLVGHSLGGGEAVALYRANPKIYGAVYPVQAVGIGGRDGSYYDLYKWDKIGDAKITEVIGDDAGPDFNLARTPHA